MNTTVQHLQSMIDLFEQGHWLQGRFEDNEGNFCLVGAALHVEDSQLFRDSPSYMGAVDALEDQIDDTMICNHVGDPECTKLNVLAHYNDHIAKSAEDVILLCKQTIATLEEQT